MAGYGEPEVRDAAQGDASEGVRHVMQGGKETFSGRSRRLERIAEYLADHSSARVQDFAEMFGVSPMTVHRDLDELERQGILRKVRGGATAQPSNLFESDIRFRIRTAVSEKEAIARLAVEYIEPGQAVLIDDSTTALALAGRLSNVGPLTVITNSLPVIQQLSSVKGIRLITLGGEYNPRYAAFTGILCEQAINSLRANVLFMSTSAVSDCTAFHQEQDIVKVKRAMLTVATQKILLIDHRKLGKVALHRLASLEEFDMVIVDPGVEPASLRLLKEAKVKVEVAPS